MSLNHFIILCNVNVLRYSYTYTRVLMFVRTFKYILYSIIVHDFFSFKVMTYTTAVVTQYSTIFL